VALIDESQVGGEDGQVLLLSTEDRFFPPNLMRRVVAERLAITPDEIAASHCAALSRPKELADMLVGYDDQAERYERLGNRPGSPST
jgi:hypothetical protein